jgi:heparanase
MPRPLLPSLFALALCLFMGCVASTGDDAGTPDTHAAAEVTPPDGAVQLSVDPTTLAAVVDPRYLSLAIDASQVVGGHWWSAGEGSTGGVGAGLTEPYDFTRPRLRRMAAPLAPAILRVGGSEADVLYYDMAAQPVAQAPEPFEFVFTRAHWDAIQAFTGQLGFDLMFTLNAGPSARDVDGAWTSEHARRLLGYARDQGSPVAAWELGNEINGYVVFHGPEHMVTGAQYAADLGVLAELVADEGLEAPVMGPSSAYWPELGEMAPVMPDFMAAGAGGADVITWHYYPQQSQRCPMASRPAAPEVMLDPANLDEVALWAAQVEALRDAHAPGTPIWLGETGNAQCGGAAGVSDRFAGSFWWLDQLGLLAARGTPIVVRQTLSGADYGLIEDETLRPNPDYFMSLLWKALMGARVLAVARPDDAPDHLRAYAHCTPGVDGGVTWLLLNLDASEALTVATPPFTDAPREVYLLTAEALTSRELSLNDQGLEVAEDGTPPALTPTRTERPDLELPPRTIAFWAVPGASVPACTTRASE